MSKKQTMSDVIHARNVPINRTRLKVACIDIKITNAAKNLNLNADIVPMSAN